MKDKKTIWIVMVIAIIALIGVIAWFMSNQKKNPVEQATSGGHEIIQQEEKKEAILDENLEVIHAKLEESDNKQYVTLFLEGNVFENTQKVRITYNSEKLILNTAQPMLQGVEVKSVEGNEAKKEFLIEVKSLENESMIFIKKNAKGEVSKEDVSVEMEG